MNKRIISLILSLVMAFAMMGTMAVSAFAANSSDTYVTSSVRHTDARNEFTNMSYTKKAGRVTLEPKHVYYTNEGLYAECYIINGLNNDIRLKNIHVKLSSYQGVIADGNFDYSNKNVVVHAGKVAVRTLRFTSQLSYNKGMDLNTTLNTHWDIDWTNLY